MNQERLEPTLAAPERREALAGTPAADRERGGQRVGVEGDAGGGGRGRVAPGGPGPRRGGRGGGEGARRQRRRGRGGQTQPRPADLERDAAQPERPPGCRARERPREPA